MDSFYGNKKIIVTLVLLEPFSASSLAFISFSSICGVRRGLIVPGQHHILI
jgi:hypothetical protein